MTKKELAELTLQIATNDYAAAKHLYDTMKPLPNEIICYLCQQTTEKSIKAVLYSMDKDVPETHSIVNLLNVVNAENHYFHLNKKDAALITRFATRTRYAERRIDVSKEDAEFALRQAQQILEQAQKHITS